MNDLETRQPNDEELFDRLVDGELTEAERRALLADLDRRTDGWRRCALAFLEAQSWSSAAREHLTARPQADVTPFVEPRRRRIEWGLMLSAAASFLIVTTATLWYRGAWDKAAPVGQQPSTIANSLRPREMLDLTLAGDNSAGPQRVQVPLVEAKSIDEATLRQPQAVLPQNLVQMLEQMGNRVQQQRQLVPIQLQDGRRAVVPVDQVEVQYVGNRDYQ